MVSSDTKPNNTNSSILRSECHLHLYGCLDLRKLWELSEARSKLHPERFHWFLNEYQKIIGQQLNHKEWWNQGESGFKLFRDQIAVLGPTSFPKFQAKFNLLIALFPPHPADMTLAKAVFSQDQKSDGYKEYRTFLPLYLSPIDRELYFCKLIETAKDHETSLYHPRIAISIIRNHDESMASYKFISEFLAKYPQHAPWITGIDFCGDETNHPPASKQLLFQDILEDNRTRTFPLAILYHVGEMWSSISLHSAARWCVEAAQLGAHRLGHALALGINPLHLTGISLTESTQEWQSHLVWMTANQAALSSFGFKEQHQNLLKNIAGANCYNGQIVWKYDDEIVKLTKTFQQALLQMIKQINPIIECCLTSNLRIGELQNPLHHPILEFLKNDLSITISTDDPGLFDISLAHEEELAKNIFHLNHNQLRICEDRVVGLFSNTRK